MGYAVKPYSAASERENKQRRNIARHVQHRIRSAGTASDYAGRLDHRGAFGSVHRKDPLSSWSATSWSPVRTTKDVNVNIARNREFSRVACLDIGHAQGFFTCPREGAGAVEAVCSWDVASDSLEEFKFDDIGRFKPTSLQSSSRKPYIARN